MRMVGAECGSFSCADARFTACVCAGVEVHTFHTRESSLPDLSDGAWPRLIRAGMQHPAGASAAAAGAAAAADAAAQHAAEAARGQNGAPADDAAAQPAAGAAAILLAEPRFSHVRVTCQLTANHVPCCSQVLGHFPGPPQECNNIIHSCHDTVSIDVIGAAQASELAAFTFC